MPDAHWGYGFPIGGVAAFDAEEGGVVFAGGVGFDISCGVRALKTGLARCNMEPELKRLAHELGRAILAGVGSTGRVHLNLPEMDRMLRGGAQSPVILGGQSPAAIKLRRENAGILPLHAEAKTVALTSAPFAEFRLEHPPTNRLTVGKPYHRMKPSLILAGALALFTTPSQAASSPNIVLIVADDLGYGDLGCFGCKDIPTPNIDSIAKAGVRFTDAHVYRVCSPTRAALLTGCYGERNGIGNVLLGRSVPRFGKSRTIARLLHEAGYATGLVGKWHLGYEGDVIPTHMGFDEFFGFLGGKIDYYKHTDSTPKNGFPNGKHDLWEGETEIFREGYSTDLFTERARRFIRDHATKPFFLELTYNAPHYPTTVGVYQAPPAYLERFGVEGNPNKTRGGYAAMVSCMDDGVGGVLAELKAQNLEGKTIVIFLSDNGAELVGSNLPFSGGKHTNKEGGIRTPWVARWPGVIPAGITSKAVIHCMDLAPTFLAAAGVKPPEPNQFDGINVWSAFLGKEGVPDRPIVFPPNAIRQGKWKMNEGKLFDLEADPGEKFDVAAQHPEICSQLSKQLEVWKQEMKNSAGNG